ncbi:MAG: [Clostridia bacterium]|nr:[FeFe] hydrogenase H-cluster maturation GTPase HydF [Clostridia bacterium]
MPTLNDTPAGNRLHIGFFGRRNSGKSTLVNALAGQKIAIVSDVAGTTTDPVYKAMELKGIGPVELIDTAGFDDEGELGGLRVRKTELAAEKTDIAVLLFSGTDTGTDLGWFDRFRQRKTPVLPVIANAVGDREALADAVEKAIGQKPLLLQKDDPKAAETLRRELVRLLPEGFELPSITAALVSPGDTVMLVMPQDASAPKGRLILPQVQTIRDLLDNRCTVIGCTPAGMEAALAALKNPPKLIITDSQAFGEVWKKKPENSRLTSFSILFAALKGDIDYYLEGAKLIPQLNENSRVLIAECCTHAPQSEDIGRVKIPKLLRKLAGEGIRIDVLGGTDFPEDLSPYALVIQCGACMFNRKYVLSRIARAKQQGVPMTNYGVFLAFANGILDKISL